MPWAQRKEAELLAKLSSVSDELVAWRADTAKDRPLEKHHTQVARITGSLEDLVRLAGQAIRDADVTTEWPTLEEDVLDIHRVWGFFRDRLAQRLTGTFRPYLVAADEYAWACYQPAQVRAVASGKVQLAKVREPPLVCLTGSPSPFAIPRGSSYAADVSGLVGSGARQVAQRLPVPVVGVPWFQLQHLPELLVLGHEVGHHVEDDFGLGPTVASLIAAASGGDPNWRRWAGEVFADVYGTLCGGPAYPLVLGDFLPSAAGTGGGRYPPVPTRLAVVLATLSRNGSADAARELAAQWAAEGRPVPADPDAAAVADALVGGPYPTLGVGALSDVVGFATNAQHAETAATQLLARQTPPTKEIRTLMAGVALAFARNPGGYADAGVARRALERVPEIQQSGTRFRGGGERRPAEARVAAADAASVQAMYALLRAGEDVP